MKAVKAMKNNIIAPWITMAIALAVATLALVPPNSTAQEKGSARGGAQQLRAKPIRTVEDLSTIQPGDMMVMSCPKCKNVTVTHVEPTFKATEPKEKVKTQHTCPGCNVISTVEGHGKAKKEVVKHVCSNCGSKNAFCCVMKKGSGPTPGMEKEKK